MVIRHRSCPQWGDPSFGRTCITDPSVSDRDHINCHISRNDTVYHYHMVFLICFSFCSTIQDSISANFACRFFQAAVRQAVVPFLSRGLPVFQLYSAIEFSMGSFVLNKRHARWSVLTLLGVGLLGTLTSAYVMFNHMHNYVLLNTTMHVAGPPLLLRSLSIWTSNLPATSLTSPISHS